MVVIQQLSTVVSTCTPLVSTLESARVAGEPGDAIEGKDAVVGVSKVSSIRRYQAYQVKAYTTGPAGDGQGQQAHQC